MKKKNNQTTIDDLAVMMNRGFNEAQKYLEKRLGELERKMATKDELKHEVAGLKTDVSSLKTDVSGLKEAMKVLVEEMNATHTDVRYIKSTVSMLTRSDTAQEASIQDLTSRVHRLEQKVGFVK